MESNNTELKITLEIAEDIFFSERSNSKAAEMMQIVLNNREEWGLAKMNRWIGYAQCLQVANGTRTLEEVKDETRYIVQRHKNL